MAFFPRGVVGRGYVLPTAEDEARLRRRLKRSFIVVFGCVVLAVVIGSGYGVGAVASVLATIAAAYIGWFHVVIERRVRKLQIVPDKLTIRDATASQAAALGWPWIVLQVVISVAFIGVALRAVYTRPSQWPLALMVIVFFGCCLVAILAVAKRKMAGRGPAA